MPIKQAIPHEKYLVPVLGLIFFSYAVSMALIFQNVLVPNMQSLSEGGKLLSNDAVYFDSVAWQLAQNIREYGWGSWQLFITPAAPANVSILAALYAVFGHDPSLAIPINAVLHSFGGILIFLLAREISDKKKVGIYAGLIASTIFIVFPSSLNWYGQIHKDGYAIAGTLLVLFIWLKVLNGPLKGRAWLLILSGSIFGVLLIGIVRPYGLMLLIPISLGAFLIATLSGLTQGKKNQLIKLAIYYSVFIAILIIGVSVTKEYSAQTQTQTQTQSTDLTWEWEFSEWLPIKLEKYIATVARIRADLIHHGQTVNAGSTIDGDIAPNNLADTIQYLPRALLVAAAAPFPSAWFSQLSMTRLIAVMEMFVYYLCVLGIFLLLRYNRRPAVWMTLYFSTVFLMILGFTIANLGTLFRVRYAYLMLLLMLGVLGWITFLDKQGMIKKIIRFVRPKQFETLPENNSLSGLSIRANRKKAVSLGIYVSILTFVGFVGFFYRDILMAKLFGLGFVLDSFFIALLIPMTIVTTLCIPLGSAFTPIFLKAVEKEDHSDVQNIVSGTSFMAVLFLFSVSVILYLVQPLVLPYLVDDVYDNAKQLKKLMTLALPILFFSGVIIIGNAVLNSIGKVIVTSSAQLIVPVVAVLAVVFFGKNHGVLAIMMGMVIGQIMNLLIVQFKVKENGYSLMPSFPQKGQLFLSPMLSQYFPLVASAFFVSTVLLVNTILATHIHDGAVSAFNLGSKFVMLVTGLIGAAISTVMLPYFSSIMAKGYHQIAKRELAVFMLMLTFLSIPLSVVLFILAEPIIRLLFNGGAVVNNDIALVIRVMQYAVVQIPFFACNVLLLKYATATKHALAILFSAIIGLIINIGVSLLLMNHMGVAGIALGASTSIVISTIVLGTMMVLYRHIRILDMVVLMLSWLLFITLLISIHFGSLAGSSVSILSYIILMVGFWLVVVRDNTEERVFT